MANILHPQKTRPGVILGPDGTPCRPCTAFRNWNPMKAKAPSSKQPDASFRVAAVAGTMGALAAGSQVHRTTAEADEPQAPAGCPADVEQLGRATWTFLHTTAAHYPEQPTAAQRTRMLGLLFALPVLYPCSWCARHLGEEIQRAPPDVSSRAGLSEWLCEQHNRVNGRLGKPIFNCSLKSTDERWKDGPSDGRCD